MMVRHARKRELVLMALAALMIVRERRQGRLTQGGNGRQGLIRLSGVSLGQCKQ